MSGPVLVVVHGAIPSCLSPNARCDRWVRSEQVRLARQHAYLQARETLRRDGDVSPLPGERDLAVRWLVERSGRAKRLDFDNLVASLKPYLDGIFDALETNDRRVISVTVRQQAIDDGDRVTCEVIAAEGA